MKIHTEPARIVEEYNDGQSYNSGIGLVETVRQNEQFFSGNQWEGVNAPDLDKPVSNVLRRPVKFAISSIVSDDIGVRVSTFQSSPGDKATMEMLQKQFSEVMELCSFKPKCRDFIQDAAVDGDGCIHYWFNPGEAESPQEGGTPGQIEAELLDNTAVFFGNPQLVEVQRQPYIILAFRRLVGDVKELAKANGNAEDAITEDQDQNGINTDQEKGKVTVLRKYYKERGRVWYTEVTAGAALVTEATDTRLGRYPLVWMCWEKVKNRYHGQAAVTEAVPNQIFVNKLLAMAMQNVKTLAFPKVVYDAVKLPKGWTNAVGMAIPSNGPPGDAVAVPTAPANMSDQVFVMLDKTIALTQDSMGANDAVLGNVKPENTSAIIAVQKQTAMPLELQKMSFYQMVEDSVRIWLEMMVEYYGIRIVEMGLDAVEMSVVPEEMGMGDMAAMRMDPAGMVEQMSAKETSTQMIPFDFSTLRGLNLRLNVDIGAATYWSELMQVQTMDNLYGQGIITDKEVYLEAVPSAYLPNKTQLLEAVRKEKREQQAMLEAQMQMEMQPVVPAGQVGAAAPPEMTAPEMDPAALMALAEETAPEMVAGPVDAGGEFPPEVLEAAAELGIEPEEVMSILAERGAV